MTKTKKPAIRKPFSSEEGDYSPLPLRKVWEYTKLLSEEGIEAVSAKNQAILLRDHMVDYTRAVAQANRKLGVYNND